MKMDMAGTDHFLDLERHRQQLEDNVKKLQTALQHWRMCDAEYEELKEEVEDLKKAPEAQRSFLIDQIGQAQREVVTPADISQLFGKNSNTSFDSIINILQHRIDYVTKNIETLEKQLEAAEHKLSVATVVMDPNVSNEEGLPFTDIVEELDENDNIVSSHLQKPGNLEPQMLEALAKVGIKGKDVLTGGEEATAVEHVETVKVGETTDNIAMHDVVRSEQTTSTPSTQQHQYANPETNPVRPVKQPSPKRSVSFAEDTKSGDDTQATDIVTRVSKNAQIVAELMEQARLQAIPSSAPVIPEDESPEDAETRREMLRYGMTDIAPIVAELEIDEEDSDYEDTGSELEDEDDDAYDENGRYKYRVVDENIHARMRELQEKLGFKSTRELMDADKRLELEEENPDSNKMMDGGIGRIVVKATPPVKSTVKSALKTEDKTADDTTAKKGVKFANTLDVAPNPTTDPVTAPAEPEPTFVDPMRGTIVERAPVPIPAAPVAASPKKVSRFKKAKTASNTTTTAALPIHQASTAVPAGPFEAPARFFDANTEVRTVPEGPEGKTLADAVVERDRSGGAKEPEDFDASLLHQEASVEYNRVRNRMIQKDGGFMKQKEAEIEYPDVVDERGKKLSRFKAARLARQ